MELSSKDMSLRIDELAIDETMLGDPALAEHLSRRIASAAGTETSLPVERIANAIAETLAAPGTASPQQPGARP